MLIRTQFQDRCLGGFRPNTELWGIQPHFVREGEGRGREGNTENVQCNKTNFKKFDNFAKEK